MHKRKESVNIIKERIDSGEIEEALHLLDELEADNSEEPDVIFYLRGNAYRKKGDWQGALNNYLEAIALNPESPAVHARQMIMDILEFYNKDMYNQ